MLKTPILILKALSIIYYRAYDNSELIIKETNK
jgi:hypothetical protein